MTLTEEELRRERDEHLMVADALASVRLFRTLLGDGEQTREWVRELVRTLYRAGCRERHGERETLLATTADAIARTYLGRSARELEWPEAGG